MNPPLAILFPNMALLGLLFPLVALPLIIHLLNRKFPQVVRFPNIERIRVSIAQRSRFLRFRHLILTVLRTAILALLVATFLYPLLNRFHASPGETADRSVLLILDHSLSMEYTGGALSSGKRALIEMEKILDGLDYNDQANLLVVGSRVESCFPRFSRNHDELLAYAVQLPPGNTRADFTAAAEAAARQFAEVEGAGEVYFISDFQRKNWAHVEFGAMKPDVRLFFVDVSAPVKNNRAVVDVKIKQSAILVDHAIPLEVAVGNYSDTVFEDRVQVVADGRTSYVAEFKCRPWSIERIQVPVTFKRPGVHTLRVAIPRDDLAADDQFHLPLVVLDKEEIVVLTDADLSAKDRAYFLQAALNPYVEQRGSLLPKPVRTADLSAIHLAASSKMFISAVGLMPVGGCEEVAKFIEGGGGVVYFLDGVRDRENVAALDKALGGGVLPLKPISQQRAENIPGGAQRIREGHFQSRFLRMFSGGMRRHLANLEFYEYYHAAATGKGRVLLTYADGTPAMATAHAQLGTVLLCNFSVSEIASNLARQRIFPGWIQDMARQLDPEEIRTPYHHPDDVIHAEVWKSELQRNAFVSPSGNKLQVASAPLGEDRLAINFRVSELGIYELPQAGQPLYAFAVNCPPEEADLRAMDIASLPERVGGAEAFILGGDRDYRTVHAGRPIFHFFLLGALALLLCEVGLLKLFNALAS